MILMSCITIGVFLGAKHLALFFNHDGLAPILMVISVIFIIRGAGSVSQGLLTRKMKFKELGFGKSVGESVSIVSAIILALVDYGVWSLVWGRVFGSITSTITYFYYSKWHPTFKIRWWAFKDIFSYGMWVFINRYLMYFTEKIDYIIIGKLLGANQLGYYERAYNIMSNPRNQLQKSINGVLFSSFSKLQDNDHRVHKGL